MFMVRTWTCSNGHASSPIALATFRFCHTSFMKFSAILFAIFSILSLAAASKKTPNSEKTSIDYQSALTAASNQVTEYCTDIQKTFGKRCNSLQKQAGKLYVSLKDPRTLRIFLVYFIVLLLTRHRVEMGVEWVRSTSLGALLEGMVKAVRNVDGSRWVDLGLIYALYTIHHKYVVPSKRDNITNSDLSQDQVAKEK